MKLFSWIDKLIYKFMEWRGPRKATKKETEEMLKRKEEIEKWVKEGK